MRIKRVDKPALEDACRDKEERFHGGGGLNGFNTFPINSSAVINHYYVLAIMHAFYWNISSLPIHGSITHVDEDWLSSLLGSAGLCCADVYG